MAISETAEVPRQVLPMVPTNLQHYRPVSRFFYNGEQTGDGSGGNVAWNLDLHSPSEKTVLYFVLSHLYAWTTDSTGMGVQFTLDSGDWLDWPAGMGPISRVLTATTYYGTSENMVKQPIILGRPIIGVNSYVSVKMGTNTNTKTYRISLGGYIYGKLPIVTRVPIL